MSGDSLRLVRLIGLLTMVLLALSPQPGSAQPSSSERSGLGQFARGLFFGSDEPLADVSGDNEWLNGLSVSGFLQNTSGSWVNSSALTKFGRAAGEHHGANSLAVQRQLVQLDVNYLFNADHHFFLRYWGVYEPPYPWEAHTILGPTFAYDHSQSQIYNRYDLRDAYWKATFGPLTLFSGRQIVTWGESIAFRVGDVINPQDLSWNFGFANLEQSRLPLWMVHPVLSLPGVGPFSSNFAEGIWVPAWQPLYTGVSYADRRYQGRYDVAGSVNLLPPGGGRFDAYPYPFSVPANTPSGSEPAFPQVRNLASAVQAYRLPANTWSNSAGGIRLHTVAGNSEITAGYWHGHQFNPATFVNGMPSSGQNLQFRYPQLNDISAAINRPIYLAGETLSTIPFVLRGEAVWQDRTPFNTIDIAHPSGVVDSSTLNTLVALDIDGIPAGWLTSTGALTANLEWNNFSILHPGRGMVYSGYAERWRHNEENVLFNVSANWWWGAIVPTLTAIYNPDGNTWELFPNVVFTPPWTNKYFVMLQYIGVLGNDKYSAYAGGVFKGKSMFLMQFQYSLDLIRGRS